MTGRPIVPPIERLLAGIRKDADTGCWEWQGTISPAGYGRIGVTAPGQIPIQFTHRVSYEHFVAPIPDGLVIDHLCRNRSCCNPDHLEAVTQKVNLRRGETLQAANLLKTHCKFGHEFSPENTRIIPRGRRCIACERRRAAESYARKKAGVEA